MDTGSVIIAALAAAVVGLASLVTWALYGWRREAREQRVTTAQLRAANDAVRMAQTRAHLGSVRIAELNAEILKAVPSRDEHGRFTARKAQDAARKLGRAK